jgi:LacI family transcriptional regulator
MAIRLRDIAKKAGVSFQAVSAVVNNSKGTVVVSDKTRQRIQRIARTAGVSITTVSHILNYPKSHKYSRGVEDRVPAVCRQLEYKPNSLARSLAKKTNSAVGVICESLDDHNITRALNRTMELAAANGLHVVVSTRPAEIPWQNLLEEGRVQWVVSIVESMVQQSRDLMRPHLLERIISVTPEPVADKIPVQVRIFWNESRNGQLAMDHLADLGHREVAILAGRYGEDTSSPRLESARLRAQERSMRVRWIMNPEERKDDIPDSGLRMTREVLENWPGVTAIYCRQDYHAIGVYRALMHAGRRIPEDMAVMGNFDLQRTLYLDPPLTSVATPVVLGVEKAMKFILEESREVRRKDEDLTDHIRLVVRGST